MNNNFIINLTTLPEIFTGDNKFIIPDYQRGYSWDIKQVEELLNDIDHLLHEETNTKHYTGTLVFTKDKKDKNSFNIVDGQQRLTTLIILISCLDKDKKLVNKYIKNGSVGNEEYIFNPNNDIFYFYKNVIIENNTTIENPITLDSHEKLLNTKETIKEWINKKNKSDEIINIIENRLGFIVYSPDNEDEIGVMFEVINNRGKNLSELEKVKNYLIYCSVKLSAKSLRNKISDSWSKLLTNLSKANKTSTNDESSFIRYCLVVFFKLNKTKSQYGYDELKIILSVDKITSSHDNISLFIDKIDKFIDFILRASVWYEKLYCRNSVTSNTELDLLLEKIRAQNTHSSIMPLFLAIVIKSNDDDKIKLLTLLEILNFRVYMSRNMMYRSDSGQGDLYQNAIKYFHASLVQSLDNEIIDKYEINTNEKALEYSLVDFTQYYAHDGWFLKSFKLEKDEPDDFYKWKGLRYFIINYESFLQKNKTISIDKVLKRRSSGKTSDYLSIEHLWATENRNDENQNSRDKDLYQRRRLGNFVLLELRLNIQGNNNDLSEKILHYLNGNDSTNEAPTDLYHIKKMAREAITIFKQHEETKKTKEYYFDIYSKIIEKQEDRYIGFAKKRWSLEKFIGYKKFKQEQG